MSRANRTTDFFMAGLDRGAGFAQQARQNRIQDEELKYVRERRAVTDARDDGEYQYLTGRRAVLDKRADDQAALESLYAPELADINAQRQALQVEQLQAHVQEMRRSTRDKYLSQAQTKMYDKVANDFIMRPRPQARGEVAMQAMRADLGADPDAMGPPAVLAGGEMGQTQQAGELQQQRNAREIVRGGMGLLMQPDLLDEFYQQYPEAIGKISPGLVEVMAQKGSKEAQDRLYQLDMTVQDLIKQGALQFAPDIVDEAERAGRIIDPEHKPFADRMRAMREQREKMEFFLDDLGITPENPEHARMMSSGPAYVERMYMRTRKTQVQSALQGGAGMAMDGELADLLLNQDNGFLNDEREAWATQLGLTLTNEQAPGEERVAALNYLQAMGKIKASGDYNAWMTRIENPQAAKKQRAAEEARADAKYFEEEAANLKAQAEVIEEQLKDAGWKQGDVPGKNAKGVTQHAMLDELAKIREARRRALSDAATSKKTAAQGTRRGEPQLLSEIDQQNQNASRTGDDPRGMRLGNKGEPAVDGKTLGATTNAGVVDAAQTAATALRKVAQGGTTAATEQDAQAIADLIAKYEVDNGMEPGTATDEEIDELIAGLLAMQHAQATPKR